MKYEAITGPDVTQPYPDPREAGTLLVTVWGQIRRISDGETFSWAKRAILGAEKIYLAEFNSFAPRAPDWSPEVKVTTGERRYWETHTPIFASPHRVLEGSEG